MEYVEVHHCGNGTSQHGVYMATNEEDYPGRRLPHAALLDPRPERRQRGEEPRRAQRDLLQLDRELDLPPARADRPRPGRRRAGQPEARGLRRRRQRPGAQQLVLLRAHRRRRHRRERRPLPLPQQHLRLDRHQQRGGLPLLRRPRERRDAQQRLLQRRRRRAAHSARPRGGLGLRPADLGPEQLAREPARAIRRPAPSGPARFTAPIPALRASRRATSDPPPAARCSTPEPPPVRRRPAFPSRIRSPSRAITRRSTAFRPGPPPPPRPTNGALDLGAYELANPGTLFLDGFEIGTTATGRSAP